MEPSAKYDVDYTDGYGLKWTKQIRDIYPSLGTIDTSIAMSNYDNDIVRYIYRKPTQYYPLYDSSITMPGGAPGQSPNVVKYAKREAYPVTDVNINTVIINASDPDGAAYSIGTNEDSASPIDRGYMRDVRLLRDAAYNKMLFKVLCREMSYTTHSTPIQKNGYDDPGFTDVSIGDVDDAKYYGLYHHAGAKVWDGSSWVDHAVSPIMMCTGEISQTFQGGGSAFNNLFNNYWMILGTGQNISFGNASSNYFWTAQNLQANMYNDRYCLGWASSYDYKPQFADDPETAYNWCKQWMLDNSVPRNVNTFFELCREVHEISDDYAVLLTVQAAFYFDNNDDFIMSQCSTYTFPMMKGSSLTKLIAGYGLYYLADNNADLTGITPNNLGESADVWLGEMSSGGSTTGKWIKGSDIASYTGYNKEGNIVNPTYDPSGGGGDVSDKVDDMTVNPLFALSSDAGFAAYFLLTASQLASLHTWLTDTAFPDGYDPYPYIISLIQFPMKLTPTWCLSGTSGHIKIGGEDTNIEAPVIGTEQTWRGLGTFKVPRLNNNFLDYDPYTQYDCYIPCAGWVSLPDIVAGHTIAVRINYDLTSASIIGNVYVNINGDYLLIASKSGMMGRETVVSGDAQGVRSAQITTALLSAGTGALNVATGLMSGNAVAAVSGGYNIVSGLAQANIAGNSSYARQIGSTGGRALLCQYDRCYLKITTTSADIPDNYGHTIGYICNKSGKVKSFSGYTVFANFDTTGITGLTERERAEVKRIMESGVYINSPPA